MTPLEMLRHHVTGAIERGEKQAIVALEAVKTCQSCNYQTNVPGDLAQHKKAYHAPGQKPCQHCGRPFAKEFKWQTACLRCIETVQNHSR